MLFRSIAAGDDSVPVGDAVAEPEEVPKEDEAPAEDDGSSEGEDKEDDETEETPMVDIPIVEEKKKPRRKPKKSELPDDDLSLKLAPFSYRDDRSGRVISRSLI